MRLPSCQPPPSGAATPSCSRCNGHRRRRALEARQLQPSRRRCLSSHRCSLGAAGQLRSWCRSGRVHSVVHSLPIATTARCNHFRRRLDWTRPSSQRRIQGQPRTGIPRRTWTRHGRAVHARQRRHPPLSVADDGAGRAGLRQTVEIDADANTQISGHLRDFGRFGAVGRTRSPPTCRLGCLRIFSIPAPAHTGRPGPHGPSWCRGAAVGGWGLATGLAHLPQATPGGPFPPRDFRGLYVSLQGQVLGLC